MYRLCAELSSFSGAQQARSFSEKRNNIDVCEEVRKIRSFKVIKKSLGMIDKNYNVLEDFLNKMKASAKLQNKAITKDFAKELEEILLNKSNYEIIKKTDNEDYLPDNIKELLSRLYFTLQFLGDPGLVAVYEVLYADKVLDENHKYSKKMELAQSYVNELAKAMKCAYGRAFIFKAKATTPIVAGRSFVDLLLEYGLAWDPVIDLPYIPASELKGAVRSFALKVGLLDFLESEYKDERSIELVLKMTGRGAGRPFTNDEVDEILKANGIAEKSSDDVANLLNSPSEEGEVGGLKISDAYPVGPADKTPLELMVITPHYTPNVEQEYEVNPVPIKYIGIGRDTELMFVVGVSKEAYEALRSFAEAKGLKIGEKDLLRTLISEALELGVGRRTSRGMGRMRIISMEEVKECGQNSG